MNPWAKNPWIEQNPGPYREGDRVRFLWGFTPVEGVIIEDEGDVGAGRRRFYRVRFQLDDNITEPMESDFPVEDLTLVAKARRGRRKGGEEGTRGPMPADNGELPGNPWAKNPWVEQNPGPYREGDRVRLLWGFTPVEGVIVEDQGKVGAAGKRFYRVRVQLDDNISEPMLISAPAEDLTLVAKAPPRSRKRRQK